MLTLLKIRTSAEGESRCKQKIIRVVWNTGIIIQLLHGHPVLDRTFYHQSCRVCSLMRPLQTDRKHHHYHYKTAKKTTMHLPNNNYISLNTRPATAALDQMERGMLPINSCTSGKRCTNSSSTTSTTKSSSSWSGYASSGLSSLQAALLHGSTTKASSGLILDFPLIEWCFDSHHDDSSCVNKTKQESSPTSKNTLAHLQAGRRSMGETRMPRCKNYENLATFCPAA